MRAGPAWLQMLVKHAGQSYRLLALAVGVLEGVTAAQLASLDQQQAEALCGPLHFLGLQLLSNHLRATSRETILNLQDRCACPMCKTAVACLSARKQCMLHVQDSCADAPA